MSKDPWIEGIENRAVKKIEAVADDPLEKAVREFLPCPFCGALPALMPWHGGGPRKRVIACENEACPASPMVSGSTRSRAIRAWNTRAPLRAALAEKERRDA